MNVKVCIGSLCHLKGTRLVVEALQNYIERDNLGDLVELEATLCNGKCQDGVSITIDNKEIFSVVPSTVEEFYNKEIKAKV
jgi:NADH:ubiquinone oxidoreductase subunit E